MPSSQIQKPNAWPHLYTILIIVILLTSTVISVYNIRRIEHSIDVNPKLNFPLSNEAKLIGHIGIDTNCKEDNEFVIWQTTGDSSVKITSHFIKSDSTQTLKSQEHYQIIDNNTYPVVKIGYGIKVKTLLTILWIIIAFIIIIFLFKIII